MVNIYLKICGRPPRFHCLDSEGQIATTSGYFVFCESENIIGKLTKKINKFLKVIRIDLCLNCFTGWGRSN